MANSFDTLAFFVAALLPGALYVWAFERQAGRWGVGLGDRVLRFVGGSVLFHAAWAPATYWFWVDQWPRIRESQSIHIAMWPLAVAYMAVPVIAGLVVGEGTRRHAGWALWLTGPYAAPRAWDYLFRQQLDGWVRFRLKSGTWLAGVYADSNGQRAYASEYPDAQDLYLSAAVYVDPDTGEFAFGGDGNVIPTGGSLLVRWDEIEYLEFIDG